MNTDLIDTFALATMTELINVYAPETLSKDKDNVAEWCETIARLSYYMAATMMDTRSTFHNIVTEAAIDKNDDNA